VADVNAESGLLLGTVGWERADWLSGYYPADLPPEWRLAYYANDCSCVLLPAASWCGVAPDRLEPSVQEAPDRLCYFLEAPAQGDLAACGNLALFEGRRAVVLVERATAVQLALPQWIAAGPGVWMDSDTGAHLVRWSIADQNLRQLRASAEALHGHVRGVVLDGPAASPGSVPELRTLLELMGKT